MYVELVPDCEQSPQKFQIVHAPTYLLLDKNYQIGDCIPASDIHLIVEHAVNLGYQVKIYPPIKYPLPAISDELADLMTFYPSDLKMRLNGMVFEQRAYVMAKSHDEICLDRKSRTLLQEAEYWLINYAREVIAKRESCVSDILNYMDNTTFREKAINTLMSWQPNWEKAISLHAKSKFEAGNNEFEVISYHHLLNKKGREGTMVMCRVTKAINKFPEFPTFPYDANCTLGTYQVENALSQRLA
ncbi:hypothetical protein H6G81_06025 [Scytonema hofmannii FACHB-248]|uniref:Uncharacterized protein n=2 Tax=Cyanophyceae TaxID=3028117 RepID=A0ABR8GL41_9CYAN|nr:hypothetical protein [Scytonema hofmannii FACHB-248]